MARWQVTMQAADTSSRGACPNYPAVDTEQSVQ
jgi:hypothetical protein